MTSSLIGDRTGSDKVAELARSHPSLLTLAKAGWVAKGIVYAIVGVLAIPIVVNGLTRDGNGTEDEASQSGAIAEIAESSWGAVALWVVAIGLGLYVIWRLVSIALPAENTASAWATRAGYLVSAVVYATLAWTAISFARHSASASGSSEDAKVERFTRDVMEMTGGRWIVGLMGVALLGIGAYFFHKGATASFRDELEPGSVGPVRHDALVRLGQVGWIGRAVMMLLIGWFLIRAAVEFDPSDAQGLDGALRQATGSVVGAVLAAVVAIGLLVYGAFCIVSAPRQRLTGAD